MAITFTLDEDEYNMLIQMLVNSNPLIQKIAKQANPQIQALHEPQAAASAPAAKTPEVVRMPSSTEQRERTR